MIFNTSQTTATESNAEVPFAFDELFFSRTDERGIILSGNNVFQRISMYTWEELLNKPHNIIRHADMPKAVFWLLWDTIKRGEPIGAYVKNRAKDGRYYWVFAIVTPIDGGYLSVRLKPSSPFFQIVEKEYKTLLAAEQNKALKPPQSAAILLKRLEELGFTNYEAFMAAALSQEIAARDNHLSRPADAAINRFNALTQAASALVKRAEMIFEAYAINEHVPLNLRVQAAQLGELGATIGVISDNYSIISTEIKASMSYFVSSAGQVSKAIDNGLFLVGTAKIQREVLELFHQELTTENNAHAQEIGYLTQQRKSYQQRALEGLRDIAHQIEAFHRSCIEMKRLAAGLEVTRIMGKVETARLIVSKDELNGLMEDLEAFQVTIAQGLKEIDQMNQNIQGNITQLLRIATA